MRLTKDDKLIILRTAVKKAFDGVIAKLEDEEHKLTSDIVDHIIGAKNRKVMSQLPDSFFYKESRFKINIKNHSKSFISMNLKKRINVPYFLNTSSAVHVSDNSCKFNKRICEYLDNKSEIYHEKDALEIKISAVLNSVTTYKKLLSVWPEADEHVPDYIKNPSSKNEVAFPISEINEAINKHAA